LKTVSQGIMVMIVDDHTLFRQGLRKLLETYEDIQVVAEASDGSEALVRLNQGQVDLVLMDVKMPRMGGVESVKSIREVSPDVGIVALSMYQESQYVVGMVEAGADGYLTKDVSADTLVDTIRHVHQGTPYPVYLALGSEALRDIAYSGPRGKRLTGREMRVLKLIAEGDSNKEIATKLSLSDQTIKGYIHTILQKLHAVDRTQAVSIAYHEGLLN